MSIEGTALNTSLGAVGRLYPGSSAVQYIPMIVDVYEAMTGAIAMMMVLGLLMNVMREVLVDEPVEKKYTKALGFAEEVAYMKA